MHLIQRAIFAGLLVAATTASARPSAEPLGRWDREDGKGGVRIARCGGSLCGDIIWLRDKSGPAYIGQRVLFNMRQTAENTWTGRARNPEDGRDYDGSMTLSGSRLMTQGCALGGMVCQSVPLRRAR